MAVYETFILQDPSELAEGKEHEILIRDAETYEQKVVMAIVSSSPEKLPSADLLRIRWQRGQPLPNLWVIKIIKDLGSVMEQPKGNFITG